MNTDFRNLVDALEPKLVALLAMSPVRYTDLPRKMPDRGIYLFSERDQHLYVGRTNRIRRRLAGHCRPSSSHFSATLAFRIARKESGFVKATYLPTGSRPALVKDRHFGPAFIRAKARVAEMDLRFVEEAHSVSQAILEIYAAVTLRTPYNDFDNH